jgi:hypothetical protein
MTGLRAAHAHTCVHAFAYFRAAEPVPSLLFSLSDISGLIQGFAREKGLFRGLFRLSRFFFIFFLPPHTYSSRPHTRASGAARDEQREMRPTTEARRVLL